MPDTTQYDEQVAKLEAQVAAIKAEQEAAAKALKERVRPQFSYTMLPCDDKFDKIYDESVKLYKLDGRITNRAECKEAGYDDHELSDGGMNYLFNTLSGKIVMAHGGGRVYVSDWSSWGMPLEEARRNAAWTITELGNFLADFPQGGDVTLIIEKHQARNDEATAKARAKRSS